MAVDLMAAIAAARTQPGVCDIAAVDLLAWLPARDGAEPDIRRCTEVPAYDTTVRRSGVVVHAPVCGEHNDELQGEPGWLRSIKLRVRTTT